MGRLRGYKRKRTNVRPEQRRRSDPCVQPVIPNGCIAIYGSQPPRLKHADHRTKGQNKTLAIVITSAMLPFRFVFPAFTADILRIPSSGSICGEIHGARGQRCNKRNDVITRKSHRKPFGHRHYEKKTKNNSIMNELRQLNDDPSGLHQYQRRQFWSSVGQRQAFRCRSVKPAYRLSSECGSSHGTLWCVSCSHVQTRRGVRTTVTAHHETKAKQDRVVLGVRLTQVCYRQRAVPAWDK